MNLDAQHMQELIATLQRDLAKLRDENMTQWIVIHNLRRQVREHQVNAHLLDAARRMCRLPPPNGATPA